MAATRRPADSTAVANVRESRADRLTVALAASIVLQTLSVVYE